MSVFESQSNELLNMYEHLVGQLFYHISAGEYPRTQEGLEEWIHHNTNSDDTDYQQYIAYIRNMTSAEIRIVIVELQQHFREYNMNVFETYSDEEITKYALCYCGMIMSRENIEDLTEDLDEDDDEDLTEGELKVVEGTEMDECCVCFKDTLYKTRCSHTLCDTCCPQLTTPVCPMCRQSL